MAIVRTVLPRKGIIEPQHGENYESDLDTNWQIIDSLLQDANDVQNAINARFVTVSAAPAAPGIFQIAHGLGRAPIGATVMMTSGGQIWFQAATQFDASYLYLVASDAGITGKVVVW